MTTTTKKRPVATGRPKSNKASRGPAPSDPASAPTPLAALPSTTTTTTRLPPSAPVSSLLPSIASASAGATQASLSLLPSNAAPGGQLLGGGGFGLGGGSVGGGMGLLPNPAQQLLSQYALLLHSAGALGTPQTSSFATAAPSGNHNHNTAVTVAAPTPDATTNTGATPSSLPATAAANNSNTATAAATAPHPLLQSLAHMVAAQAQAVVVAQAQAAAAVQAHHHHLNAQAAAAAAATAAASARSTTQAPASSAAPANPAHGSSSAHNNNNFILPNGLQNWPSAASSQGHSTVQPTTNLAPPPRSHQTGHHHPHHQARSHPPPQQQAFSLLLSEAQRRHDKKEAKRVANRKSASVSRARKKALVQEMTQLNARLKRQALILALLPDLVLALDSDGRITFCSEQVGRVLRHCPDDVLGAPLADLLVPSSRTKLHKLLQGMVAGPNDNSNGPATDGKLPHPPTERQTTVVVQVVSEASAAGPPSCAAGNNAKEPPSTVLAASANTVNAAAPSTKDAPFPLSVVNVEPAPPKSSSASGNAPVSIRRHDDPNDASDTSASRGSQQPSSLTNSGGGASVSRSPLAAEAEESSGGHSRSGDASRRAPPPPDTTPGGGGIVSEGKKSSTKGLLPSSDTSNTSSSASFNDAEVKKLTKANANLGRNVRWHNKKMMQSKRSSGGNDDDADDDDDDDVEEDLDGGFKDDVLGAAVTANNASARLSSLRVLPESEERRRRPEQPASSEEEEDDSGYRESNESREESSSSSASDDSDTNGRRKPLAPTCNICLIRNDLTTVWCEVTSSVRTRELDEAVDSDLQDPTTTLADDNDPDDPQGTARVSGASQASAGGESFPEESQPRRRPAPMVKELLLCLRPIRDGDERVDEKYRFVPFHGRRQQQRQGVVSEGSGSYFGRSVYDGGDKASSASDSGAAKRRAEEAEALPRKVRRTGIAGEATTLGVDAAVAESLVLMSSKKA